MTSHQTISRHGWILWRKCADWFKDLKIMSNMAGDIFVKGTLALQNKPILRNLEETERYHGNESHVNNDKQFLENSWLPIHSMDKEGST